MNVKGTKKKNQVVTANIFEQQELLKKAEVIKENLTASTWHELETNGKFDKNEKLSFISEDMLILGCDVGSEAHYLRAIDTRGRELSKSAFSFSNDSEGFQSAKEWAVKIVNAPKQGVVISSPMCVKLSENKFSGGTQERKKNNHMGRADPCLPE